MHSSRMRTARTATIRMVCVYLVPGGVPGPGGVPAGGVYLVPGGVPAGGFTWSGGVYLVWGGVSARGCTLRGVYLVWGVYLVQRGVPGPGGCTWSGLPPPREQNDKLL